MDSGVDYLVVDGVQPLGIYLDLLNMVEIYAASTV